MKTVSESVLCLALAAALAACNDADALQPDGFTGDSPDAYTPWPEPDFGPGTDADAKDVAVPDTGPWNAPDIGGTTRAGKVTAGLAAASSCADITDMWRQAAIDAMAADLMAQWYRAAHWYYPCPDYDSWGVQDSAAWDVVCEATTDSGGSDGASEYSTTNVQVAGVDEADFLKNDGKWIYMLAGGRLQILDAWPPEQAHKVSSTPIDGTPIAMYADMDVAVVYSSLGGYGGDPVHKCTHGYDCEFTGDGNDTKITVLDISDRAKPKLMREVRFNGSYLTSRRIGPVVYTIVHFPEPNVLPMGTYLETMPYKVQHAMSNAKCGQGLGLDPVEVKALFEELFAKNKAEIEAAPITAWIPSVTDTWYVGNEGILQGNPLTDCEGYLLAGTGDGMALLSLVSFDMTTGTKLAATTIRSRPGAVYASDQALYLAMRHQNTFGGEWFEGMQGTGEVTTVHKFELAVDAPVTKYVASGLVKGRVLNQFSMGEHDGRLQIATTTGHVPHGAYNTIAVLEPKDDELVTVGMLDNLAPDEDIRSVRFGGDLAFVVTFKKTDPLFVIDMSDPANPTVKGELKIPGFSTYMHFMDATHLLSIGFDAQDMGSYALFQGVMLQVFDVTDITNPQLMHKEVIGTRGSASDATGDHLAFNFFKPKDLLAIPMVVCDGSPGGGTYGDTMTFNGLMVYRVTVADGFQYQGGIPHATVDNLGYYGGCGQWWTQSTSTVKRSIFMDDYAVSVAFDAIEFSKLTALDKPVATVDLE
jgi:hypothetical protein